MKPTVLVVILSALALLGATTASAQPRRKVRYVYTNAVAPARVRYIYVTPPPRVNYVYLPAPAPVQVATVQVIQAAPRSPRPLITATCVATTPSGICSASVQTYSVNGISCTEDCLAYGDFDTCELKSTCAYDAPSGCFTKTYCADVGDFNHCEQWDSQAICN